MNKINFFPISKIIYKVLFDAEHILKFIFALENQFLDPLFSVVYSFHIS